MSRFRHTRWLIVILIGLLMFGLYVPLPYFISRPGSALELAPLINVEGGKKDEAGKFMLTTVRMGQANTAWYIYALLSPDAELIDRDLVLNKGESSEDFTKRELAVMQDSQMIAEAMAFQRAGYPVKVDRQGVLVMGTLEGMPAATMLKIGDIITKIDNQRIQETNDLFHYLAGKKPGDQIALTFVRDSQEQQASLTLVALPTDKGQPTRAGFGIRPANKQSIEVPKKVTIASDKIGGPSAGLMFTLEIYDQLKPDIDLTKGYRIAGTGTINADGTVGRIGGINHKIVAAENAGAEIFLAPDDSGSTTSNYQEALATAKRIGTKMKIVPVKTLDDAIVYLEALTPKKR
ncbi:MAG: SepM family pheromone-processing serine protease [Clostridia bacterium]